MQVELTKSTRKHLDNSFCQIVNLGFAPIDYLFVLEENTMKLESYFLV